MARSGGHRSRFLTRGYHRSWLEIVTRRATKLADGSSKTVDMVAHSVRATVGSAEEFLFATIPVIALAAASDTPATTLAAVSGATLLGLVGHSIAEQRSMDAFTAVTSQLERPPGQLAGEGDHDECGHGDLGSSDPRKRLAGWSTVAAQSAGLATVLVPANVLAAAGMSPLPATLPAVAAMAALGIAERNPAEPKSRAALAAHSLRLLPITAGSGTAGIKLSETLAARGDVLGLVQDPVFQVGLGAIAADLAVRLGFKARALLRKRTHRHEPVPLHGPVPTDTEYTGALNNPLMPRTPRSTRDTHGERGSHSCGHEAVSGTRSDTHNRGRHRRPTRAQKGAGQ